MMATAAVIGVSTGKRLLSSSFYYSDLTEKLSNVNDHGITYCQTTTTKNVIVAKKSSNYEDVDTASASSTVATWFETFDDFEEESSVLDYSVEALLLLQKSMLEKQWSLSFERTNSGDSTSKKTNKKIPVTCSGVSARQRRVNNRRKNQNQTSKIISSPDLLQNRLKGYVKGVVSDEVLPHAEVVRLSRIIRAGLSMEDHKSRFEYNNNDKRSSAVKERLGCEPSDEQIRELAMSNVRLVMSIAQKYDNMGAEMADLVQGGLIGLLRGIEKFDSTKGFKISTYVYWWIRQVGLIRNAKIRLEEKGVTPSIDRIAESLNMSQRKVRNATEAISKVFSLDREAFPSLNGLPGETHHSVSEAQLIAS
ncbi:RNA polymerase sigma factor sigA [Salix suchowensis]|nr:RNA polymerase sigma factor sigA [Salix suchowensis]